jgi:FkbM family methyltransferase
MPDKMSDEIVRLHDTTIIFEPMVDAYEACSQRYRNAIVLPYACGEESGTATFHHYNGGLSSSLGTVSDVMVKLYNHVKLDKTGESTVEVVNLYEKLTELGVTEIDNLFIDTQGMDLTILKTLEPMIASYNIGYIQAEADGDGVDLYYGLPYNRVDGFLLFMDDFPRYKFGMIPGRVSFNPDLYWELT